MDLTKKLTMDHLQKDDEQVREELESSQAPAGTPPSNPMDEELYPFAFKFTDAKGREYSGDFVNRILSIQDKMNVAALESTFNGGQPHDSIDPMQQVVNRGVAWMTFSLLERKNLRGPKTKKDVKGDKWAKNLRALLDDDLVIALFQEVSAHEGHFHGRTESEGTSEDTAGDAQAST